MVICTLADSYISSATQGAGPVAELAVSRKIIKYADLSAFYIFQPVAIETCGPINVSALDFLSDLDRQISNNSGDFT
jgi:hypothetical protein